MILVLILVTLPRQYHLIGKQPHLFVCIPVVSKVEFDNLTSDMIREVYARL